MYLQIKQLKTDVPAGTIQPTHKLLVRDAHSAAESVLLSSACAAINGVMPYVHISNTPSSTNVIVELDGLLQASKQQGGPKNSKTFEFLTICRLYVSQQPLKIEPYKQRTYLFNCPCTPCRNPMKPVPVKKLCRMRMAGMCQFY